MANSLMYFPPQGFSVNNKSLSGSLHDASSQVRMIFLGTSEVTLVFSLNGNQIIWGMISELTIPWGNNTEILYETCQSGWIYDWNVDTGIFTVTDAEGTVITHEGVTTISDLKISWDILQNSQFHIYKTRVEIFNDMCIIAERASSSRQSVTESLNLREEDSLIGKPICGYFTCHKEIDPVILELQPIIFDGIEQDIYHILLADTDELNFINYYPLDIYAIDNPKIIERKPNEFKGYMHEYALMMIMCFAEKLLSTDSKIVYEPWMLYAMFQWLFQQPHHSVKEPIFDLSPRWG